MTVLFGLGLNQFIVLIVTDYAELPYEAALVVVIANCARGYVPTFQVLGVSQLTHHGAALRPARHARDRAAFALPSVKTLLRYSPMMPRPIRISPLINRTTVISDA